MKKLVLGIMILAGMTAFAAPGQGDSKSASVNLTAHSAGALDISADSSEMDFGNLRAYKGEVKNATITVNDTALADNQTSTVQLAINGNTNLVLTKKNTGDTDYKITVTPTVKKSIQITGKRPETLTIPVVLDQAAANVAPAGQYAGSFTVTASYDI
ncbi:MAG: hypothetical protein RR476_01570 [Cetobacterium sp.]|uniref:hypothetical protein n=1 Tax=Cetobacterium sp. TaxID=2071632 RepID=UPI002FC63D2C